MDREHICVQAVKSDGSGQRGLALENKHLYQNIATHSHSHPQHLTVTHMTKVSRAHSRGENEVRQGVCVCEMYVSVCVTERDA